MSAKYGGKQIDGFLDGVGPVHSLLLFISAHPHALTPTQRMYIRPCPPFWRSAGEVLTLPVRIASLVLPNRRHTSYVSGTSSATMRSHLEASFFKLGVIRVKR